MKVVLVAPMFDEATEYSYKWSQRLKKICSNCDFIELGGKKITREENEKVISDNPDAVYIFYDHGTEDALYGSENEKILDVKNIWKCKGRIIYTMACLSARKLGAVAHSSYGCVYIGYVESFAFVPEDEELFCFAANSGFIAYVKGERDWKVIKKKMINAFNDAINKLIRLGRMWSAALMRHDRDSLRVYAEGVDAPQSACPLRRFICRILGNRLGWKINLSIALSSLGIGLYVHDRILEWKVLGERLHGIDIGLLFILTAYLILLILVVRTCGRFIR